jgi:hypothetical protein
VPRFPPPEPCLARIAYLVLAHENPKHLRRLIDSLDSPAADFFVHLDRKSRTEDFAHIRGEHVHFTRRRVPVHWGDFSIVEATIQLLRDALAHSPRVERLVLISGADFPVRSARYIEEFFDRHRDEEFMHMIPMPSEEENKPLSRLTQYKARRGAARINWLIRAAFVRLGAISNERDYKAHLRSLEPFAGSQWWALSRRACEYILEFIDRERRVVKFFRHTHCPDESLFHTILGNSAFRDSMRRELTYADWSAGGPSPALISDAHLERLRDPAAARPEGAEILFARKFSDQSSEVVARLQRMIRGEDR